MTWTPPVVHVHVRAFCRWYQSESQCSPAEGYDMFTVLILLQMSESLTCWETVLCKRAVPWLQCCCVSLPPGNKIYLETIRLFSRYLYWPFSRPVPALHSVPPSTWSAQDAPQRSAGAGVGSLQWLMTDGKMCFWQDNVISNVVQHKHGDQHKVDVLIILSN